MSFGLLYFDMIPGKLAGAIPVVGRDAMHHTTPARQINTGEY